MTTQIEVVDINDNTDDNNEVPPVAEVRSEEVKQKRNREKMQRSKKPQEK